MHSTVYVRSRSAPRGESGSACEQGSERFRHGRPAGSWRRRTTLQHRRTKMTFTEAAEAVLRKIGKPLHYKKITQLAIDTHGHTDFAMALAKLLGFDLCPRLKALKDRHLFLPRGTLIPLTCSRSVPQASTLAGSARTGSSSSISSPLCIPATPAQSMSRPDSDRPLAGTRSMKPSSTSVDYCAPCFFATTSSTTCFAGSSCAC